MCGFKCVPDDLEGQINLLVKYIKMKSTEIIWYCLFNFDEESQASIFSYRPLTFWHSANVFSLVSAIVIFQNSGQTLNAHWSEHEETMMVGLIKLLKSVFELLTSCNCCHGHNREEIFPEGVDRKTPRGHPVSPLETGHKGDSDTSFLHKTFRS